MARKRNEKKKLSLIHFFFSDGLTLELRATILKTGWCFNIRSKEEFKNKLWSLSYGIQEQNPQTLPKFIKQNNNFRFPCNHVTCFFSEIT